MLGHWRHPTSGNNLVAGINLNYLSQQQRQQLQQALPQLLKSRNLKQRYWMGRRLLPQIFTNFYRTYRRDVIDTVTPQTLRFGRPAAQQAAAGQVDTDRQARLAQLAALLQKQRERADQAQAQQAQVLPPEVVPPQPPGPPAAAAADALQALQAQVAQQRQAQEPPPEEVRAAVDAGGPPEEVDVPPVAAQDQVVDLGGEVPPEELEQERHLPLTPEPDETIEGQTGEPDDEDFPPLPELEVECRLGPDWRRWGPTWASPAGYIRWHDPARVLTVHPTSGLTVLEHGRGPVLAAYDVDSRQTIVDRALDHTVLLAEAGWDHSHTIRFLRHDDGLLVMAGDLPASLRARLLREARCYVGGLDLLTEV